MDNRKVFYVTVREVWTRVYAVPATSGEDAVRIVNDTTPNGSEGYLFEYSHTLPVDQWDVSSHDED